MNTSTKYRIPEYRNIKFLYRKIPIHKILNETEQGIRVDSDLGWFRTGRVIWLIIMKLQ